MKEKIRPKKQLDLFRSLLAQIIDLEHELCHLADKINWNKFEVEFAEYFPAKVGNPALPTRLILGVLYLKYIYGLSDEETVARWTENPYWQYFSGQDFFHRNKPCTSFRYFVRG